MKKQEVIDLMESSMSTKEWNENCDKVKKAHLGHYPDYWYSEMIASGRCNKIMGPGSSEIKIGSAKPWTSEFE
jgi:hypothetical protein